MIHEHFDADLEAVIHHQQHNHIGIRPSYTPTTPQPSGSLKPHRVPPMTTGSLDSGLSVGSGKSKFSKHSTVSASWDHGHSKHKGYGSGGEDDDNRSTGSVGSVGSTRKHAGSDPKSGRKGHSDTSGPQTAPAQLGPLDGNALRPILGSAPHKGLQKVQVSVVLFFACDRLFDHLLLIFYVSTGRI
jgi:hypothetical protein